ncbi:VP2 [Thetapolyomavirus trepennellii]|uniref:VP2 n=1 Tax=Thetapolyomavirus trepennellii TaxID=2170103 RepID=A0A0E3JDD9_9POLY|nr:VP2 [Thetapolyomavirus trepennellii]AJZ72667.1 VP2 [Thetapolyomavirus trepennellii]
MGIVIGILAGVSAGIEVAVVTAAAAAAEAIGAALATAADIGLAAEVGIAAAETAGELFGETAMAGDIVGFGGLIEGATEPIAAAGMGVGGALQLAGIGATVASAVGTTVAALARTRAEGDVAHVLVNAGTEIQTAVTNIDASSTNARVPIWLTAIMGTDEVLTNLGELENQFSNGRLSYDFTLDQATAIAAEAEQAGRGGVHYHPVELDTALFEKMIKHSTQTTFYLPAKNGMLLSKRDTEKVINDVHARNTGGVDAQVLGGKNPFESWRSMASAEQDKWLKDIEKEEGKAKERERRLENQLRHLTEEHRRKSRAHRLLDEREWENDDRLAKKLEKDLQKVKDDNDKREQFLEDAVHYRREDLFHSRSMAVFRGAEYPEEWIGKMTRIRDEWRHGVQAFEVVLRKHSEHPQRGDIPVSNAYHPALIRYRRRHWRLKKAKLVAVNTSDGRAHEVTLSWYTPVGEKPVPAGLDKGFKFVRELTESQLSVLTDYLRYHQAGFEISGGALNIPQRLLVGALTLQTARHQSFKAPRKRKAIHQDAPDQGRIRSSKRRKRRT